jgi:ATP-dependent Clp protease, protease subunit
MALDKQHVKGKVANIVFSAEISPGTAEGLIAAVTQCVVQGATGIRLWLSTQGGSVLHGVHIYNMLRGLPVPLTTHNTGSVNSIGNAIFLAGETRYAVPGSTFMFHGVGFDITNARFEEKTLRERLDGLLADQKRIGSIIKDRTNLTDAEVKDLFLEAKTQDTAFAKSKGIIDEVRGANVPSGEPIVTLVFQR